MSLTDGHKNKDKEPDQEAGDKKPSKGAKSNAGKNPQDGKGKAPDPGVKKEAAKKKEQDSSPESFKDLVSFSKK